MKKSNCEKNDYLAPVVKSVSFKVESGFAGSPGESTNPMLGLSTEALQHGGNGRYGTPNDNFNGYF